MNVASASLTGGDFTETLDPLSLFRAWAADARAAEINDPDAMALATVDEAGLPDVRMVLMKGFDSRGIVFYTNAHSAKGRELAANPRAALLFHWKSLRRQIRVRGTVDPASDAEADAYFASRSRASQIGAWASDQSQPLDSRITLDTAAADYAMKFAGGPVARPPHWKGFRLAPASFEFWSDGAHRLHDRALFTREGENWRRQRLFP
jgi:pyridoxamine 5'-phosphate oxidase